MAGRPLKFKTVEELQQKIDAYFVDCDAQEAPYTITGLCLALGTYRDVLIDYETRDDRTAYSNTIKNAKLRCENFAERRLMAGAGHPAGPIFALKNYGWRDKQELEHTGDVRIEISMVGSS